MPRLQSAAPPRRRIMPSAAAHYPLCLRIAHSLNSARLCAQQPRCPCPDRLSSTPLKVLSNSSTGFPALLDLNPTSRSSDSGVQKPAVSRFETSAVSAAAPPLPTSGEPLPNWGWHGVGQSWEIGLNRTGVPWALPLACPAWRARHPRTGTSSWRGPPWVHGKRTHCVGTERTYSHTL